MVTRGELALLLELLNPSGSEGSGLGASGEEGAGAAGSRGCSLRGNLENLYLGGLG